ncbi:MAG: hypothetical protein IJO41_00805 [Oscillospiraceae bacterium]|nr:hypothetical protein [Oscillospiraceae bacterium]MBQ9836517.1 hypothetical protein [Oscillospiraceae bacterium]
MIDIRKKLVELLGKAIGDAVTSTSEGKDVLSLDDMASCLIANGVTVQEWITVSEPPKEWRRDNGEMINYLVYVPEFGVDIGNYGEPAKCWLCMGLPCKPTHWAHLPTPPKQEG